VAQTIEQTPASAPAGPGRPADRAWLSPWSPFVVAVASAAGLLVVSLLILLWAKTRPGFDPYGWLVWGRQTVAGNLNTNAAPSWKPLPYLFTAPYGLFGHYQLWLWMVTSLAVSLAGAVFAARIAYRLTLSEGEPRWPAYVAAAFAGLALLGLSSYWHYMLSAQSDPMIVTVCLGAIDCHLSGRYRWAYTFGALAALGRPEVWLFLGLYTIWAWVRVPSMRRLIVVELVLVVVLWFGIPALTSRTPFVAASNALGSGRRLRSDRVFGTIGRFLDLNTAVIELTALLAVVLAVVRRDRVTLALAAGVCAWVFVEIAFALHGWPGLGRYMYEPAGVLVVLAGVGVGRVLAESRRISRVVGWAGIALVAVIVLALVPPALSRARSEHHDIVGQRTRTAEIGKLTGTISRLGAARLRACGEPLTRLEYQTILAWNLHVNVATVGYKYGPAVASHRPIVLFTPLPQGGWLVQALHQRSPGCISLP
jgi:arginine exporter protein ArgO